MDIKKEILKEHSKNQTVKIVNFIGSNRERFAELVQMFLGGPYRITQRAAWPLSYCVENHPALVKPHLRKLVSMLNQEDTHDSAKRNIVRLLQFIDIPQSLQGKVVNHCLRFLHSNEPIAVKVFAMSVLGNLTKEIPELKTELKIIIEDQLPFSSAGFKSRAKKVLKQIA